jgi:hypothetical protein
MLLLAFSLLLVGAESYAAPASTEPVEGPRRIVDTGVTVDGLIGGGSMVPVDGKGVGGFAVGSTGLFQYDLLEVGGGMTFGSGFFGPSLVTLGVLSGFRVHPVPWFRLELLADTGLQSLSDVGADWFSHVVSDGTAVLPYLGGRVGLAFLVDERRTILFGWWFNGGSTVAHTKVHPILDSCSGCSTTIETHTVGGGSFSTGLRIGAFIH